MVHMLLRKLWQGRPHSGESLLLVRNAAYGKYRKHFATVHKTRGILVSCSCITLALSPQLQHRSTHVSMGPAIN